jgi:hypothetical protein
MKISLLIATLLCAVVVVEQRQDGCSIGQPSSESLPGRLVIIKGKATFINFPGRKDMPASSERLIFQKVGCESCFIGASVDSEGNYQIIVGDGKYKIIVRNPSSPQADWLAPDQQKFIDTGSMNSPNSIFNFDIKIRIPD